MKERDVLSPSQDLLGRKLGGYELEQLIGAGVMGRVYRASRDRQSTAIKVLHPDLAQVPELVERFEREVRAMSLVRHPNIVEVLGSGAEQGLHFFVMEYVAGGSLADVSRARGLRPMAGVIAVTRQLLLALEAAHASGVVHRDLKPENVLVVDPGDAPRVKLADFGLAHLDNEGRGSTLTGQNTVAGTFEFMSPEQCQSLRVGPSTDLYAVGCLLTELLQGAPPFRGRTSAEVVAHHMFTPVPPLDRPLGAEPVPDALEQLRRALLAKAAHQRPPNASVALAQLNQVR